MTGDIVNQVFPGNTHQVLANIADIVLDRILAIPYANILVDGRKTHAVAMGLSAINQYVGIRDGENTVEDYVRYVRQDLMGISREDLVYNIARHVDSTVHLFEKWGLKIWLDEDGKYVHEGRWQLM